ncbi:MAG: hypothetical protein WA322_15620 [Pseudolabrys sp.]
MTAEVALMTAKLIESIGLLLNIAGAIVLAWGLMIDRKTAIGLGVDRHAGATDEENLRPTVKDRLRQSQNAEIGLALLVFGFIGQLVAHWIS